MKLFSTLLFFFVISGSLKSQDTYHSNLSSQLMADYSLPSGEWIFSDTESANYNSMISYGCAESQVSISGQDFSIASEVVIAQQGDNPWDAGWKIDNLNSINEGDAILLVIWLRSTGGSDGDVNIFVERNSDYAKEIYVSTIIGSEWTQYFIPFEAALSTYSAAQLSMGFHLAKASQTLQIGGFTAINYGTDVDIEDLPSNFNSEQYGGYEDDAPWRAPAAERIDNLRKANLTITAQQTDGTPVSDAAFDIEMLEHEFAFGSAITAARIAGNNDQNVTYENKITNLDGEGHGFNWVVFENDLKWDAWEEEWFVNPTELVNAVDWLYERDIKVRGHALVWPGYNNLPDDIQANAGDADYIWNRIDGRLNEILNYPGLEPERIPEWDCLNEIVTNTSLESTFATVPGNTTGRELYADIFERAKEISPETKMYINDYVTLTLNNTSGGQYQVLKDRIQDLLDAGAPVEGIGFQSHIGAFPNGIPSVLNTLDDFYNSFGLTAKVTEFDLPPNVSEELASVYLRDFMTAVFSHESMDGFLFWNFWDGATWANPGANLYRQDWSRTPAGDTFVDLVFGDWWTHELKTTNTDGNLTLRGFKGKYKITYECDGQMVSDTIYLSEDQNLSITCDALQTDVEDLSLNEALNFTISPNPVGDVLRIERNSTQSVQAILFNSLGAKVFETTISDRAAELDVADLKGIYFLELSDKKERSIQKVIIH